MADEINVGRLVAEIVLESKTDGANELANLFRYDESRQ